MSNAKADIALLTDRRYTAPAAPAEDWYLGNILKEDALLSAALKERGLTAVRLDWSRPDVDWSDYRCLVFRTTWDYFDRFAEFSKWLDEASRATRLVNAPHTIRWNLDKHYLADLAKRGIPVVESVYLESGDTTPLAQWLRRLGWKNAVVKPCISGAARHTYRLDASTAPAVETTIRPLLATESFILQPFQESIVGMGGDTLMVFGGRYTHAVRKVAKAGDFRVQDDFGGTLHDLEPTGEQIDLARAAMEACGDMPAYGRVDMVRDNRGRLAVMELELIEPELWLRRRPPAAEAFARAIVNALCG